MRSWPSISSRLACELRGELIELVSERRIDEPIAYLDLRTSDERWIHRERRLDGHGAVALELPDQVGALRVAERDGSRDLGLRDACSTVHQITEGASDLRQEGDATAKHEQIDDPADRARFVL